MARTEVRGGQIKDGTVDLTVDVTGTLPVGNGGTGAASQTLNNVLLGNGTGAFQNVAPSTAGKVLRSDGTTWSSTALTADDMTDGTTNHVFTAADDTKLAGVASGATANDTDANLKNRANHTGTQTASTISDFNTAADARVAAATIAVSQLGTGKVVGSVNGTSTSLTLWTGTQAQYNALGAGRPSTTVYIVTA